MARKTYYPGLYRQLVRLARYMAKYNAKMIHDLDIAGTPEGAALNTLVNTINDILNNWPAYREVA